MLWWNWTQSTLSDAGHIYWWHSPETGTILKQRVSNAQSGVISRDVDHQHLILHLTHFYLALWMNRMDDFSTFEYAGLATTFGQQYYHKVRLVSWGGPSVDFKCLLGWWRKDSWMLLMAVSIWAAGRTSETGQSHSGKSLQSNKLENQDVEMPPIEGVQAPSVSTFRWLTCSWSILCFNMFVYIQYNSMTFDKYIDSWNHHRIKT